MKNFFVCFFTIIILFNQRIYSDHLASHGEVAIFRAKNQVAINAQKAALGTNLDVLGALRVLELDLIDRRIALLSFLNLYWE